MSEWISVKDRLPDPAKYVLISQRRDGVCVGYLMNKYGTWWKTPDGPVSTKDITHWMPLPAPPTEAAGV